MHKQVSKSHLQVGDRKIGADQPAFIIAEIGNNHNGSLETAKEMVEICREAQVDAVKFQLRNMDELYGKDYKKNKASLDLGAQYTVDILEKYQFSAEQMLEILDYCNQRGILAFCTPWDLTSLEILEKNGSALYKIASADFTNHDLLRRIAETGKPMICSTGMSNEGEIVQTVRILREADASFALLHCNSTYPTPFKDVNLHYLTQLKNHCSIVGYSGHERGFHVPLAAIALGAHIIEKHFTLDKGWEGVDHKVSLLPAELTAMVRQIRELEQALGKPNQERALSQGEIINRENLGKSVVARTPIRKGEVIQREQVSIRSPGQGLPPYQLEKLIGLKALRDVEAGGVFFSSDISGVTQTNRGRYNFSRPWGIPVRYHDFNAFLKNSDPDFVEFHLSYGDMEENISKHIHSTYRQGFTVHAPELFAGDLLLDLCSSDPEILRSSMINMERVIEITIQLKKYFPSTVKPLIVATVGGFTKDRPLTKSERIPLYKKIIENLRKLENPEVEILPQSTAPFPWHMGGQQYQNLFLYPDEIKQFCEDEGYRICLDISHSYMACLHLGIDPREFFTTVAPYSAHLHLGDCAGVDGEGVQMGQGDVDFKILGEIFKAKCPKASFIPEVWQGHKNNGEGFWTALEFLEPYLS